MKLNGFKLVIVKVGGGYTGMIILFNFCVFEIFFLNFFKKELVRYNIL